MASLNVQTPDGKSLTVQVPDGTDPKQYGALADDALSHYTSVVAPPSEGKVGSFLRAVGNNLPLGNQFASLVSPGSYSQNMAAINASTEKDKTANPISYGAGAVAGTVAPALVPGVGEMMAANPATVGAALGGTNAISNTDVSKDPLQAINQAGTGAATGALLSGLIAKALPAPSTLNSMANSRANASINMPSGILVNMTPEEQQAQGAFLRSAGLVGKDKSAILDNARDLMSGYGQKIGSIGQDLSDKGLSVEDPNEITQPLIEKFAKFSQSANPEAKQMARTYLSGIKDIENLATPEIAEQTVRGPGLLDAAGKAIESTPPEPIPITWSKLQDLKETYGGIAFKPSGEIKNQAAADVYFSLSNALKGIAEKATQNPEIPPQYQEALAGYSRMSPIVSGLEKTVDSDLRGASGTAGGGFHPMRMLAAMPGPVRAIGGTIAALTGHPMIAAAAALPEALNPAVQSNVLGGLSSKMPMIQNLISQSATRAATNPINTIGQNPQAKQKLLQILQQLQGNQQGQQ